MASRAPSKRLVPPSIVTAAVRVAGIGAPAGRVDAFLELGSAICTDRRSAFVSIRHLASLHDTHVDAADRNAPRRERTPIQTSGTRIACEPRDVRAASREIKF